MKDLWIFAKKAMWLTIGMILTLVALGCLTIFIGENLDFEYNGGYFLSFVVLFGIGFPVMLFGITRLRNADD